MTTVSCTCPTGGIYLPFLEEALHKQQSEPNLDFDTQTYHLIGGTESRLKKAMDINRISMINSSGEIIFKAVSLAVPEDAFEGFLNYIKNSHEKRKTEPFCTGFAPHTFQSR